MIATDVRACPFCEDEVHPVIALGPYDKPVIACPNCPPDQMMTRGRWAIWVVHPSVFPERL